MLKGVKKLGKTQLIFTLQFNKVFHHSFPTQFFAILFPKKYKSSRYIYKIETN